MLPQPGDVLVVYLRGARSFLTSVGAWLCGGSFYANHIAIVISSDTVIEAYPGGVRLGELSKYVSRPHTRIVRATTVNELAPMLDALLSKLGSHYDWFAVLAGILRVFYLDTPFLLSHFPKHDVYVCSSLASWAWVNSGLEAPSRGRFTIPADWALLSEPL